MASSKKGISAHQRSLGITYKSAWFRTHRIREAMRAGGFAVLFIFIHWNAFMASKRKVPLPVDPKAAGNFPVLVDLPQNFYEGIGKIIAAHALLENCVSETMFDLMRIDYPEGRVAFGYRAASAQFDIVKRLVELRGIKVPFDLVALDENIEEACTARDQLAHGVWIERSGIPALRLTKGTYSTSEGHRSRATLPQAVLVEPGYFNKRRQGTLDIVKVVQDLQAAIKIALQTSPNKSEQQS